MIRWGMESPTKIHISASLLKKIKDSAKAMMPKEDFGILLGTLSEGDITICDVYFPPDRANHTTENSVPATAMRVWYRQARKILKKRELLILGDTHSHPFSSLPEPSAGDLACELVFRYSDLDVPIFGITAVLMTKKGKHRAVANFWFQPRNARLVITQ